MDIGDARDVETALDRTTEGPRLVAPVDPTPGPTTAPPAPFVGDLSGEHRDEGQPMRDPR